MAKVYASLIHEYVTYGIEDIKFRSIKDVPPKYQAATRTAYEQKYGRPAPEE